MASEFVVSVNFTTWEFFVLSVGDYIEVGGKRFSVKKEYRPKKTNTQKYTYNISFYGREHDMQDLLFCRLNQGVTTWNPYLPMTGHRWSISRSWWTT